VEPVIAGANLIAGDGPVPVLRDVSIEVAPGEVVVLLGANGAGKTTTLLTLSGQLKPTSGAVQWLGSPIRGPLHKRARRGLRMVPERRAIFPSLTTEQSLRLGGKALAGRALELFPELRPLLKRPTRLLSGGEQQMLVTASALAAEPAVLLADELSLGLAPIIVQRLLTAIRAAATNHGLAVLLVEQQVRAALEIADRAYVMERGAIVLQGTAAEVSARTDQIESAYLSGLHIDAARTADGHGATTDERVR
jgi:branched-chain amino acid transport system ATP-binding protein